MQVTSPALWSDRLGRGIANDTTLYYQISAAKTLTPKDGSAAITAFDAISAQSTIDNFLGTSSEFTIAKFDATAMGTDTVAFIVDFGGQIAEVIKATVTLRSSTSLATIATATVVGNGALTDSSNTIEALKGANGNFAFRFVASGLDALTAGLIELEIVWRSK